MEPQRECEFRVPARGLKSRIHYGTPAGMQISSTSNRPEMQNSLRNHSWNANFECQQSMSVKSRIHYGTQAGMILSSASKGLEMQNSIRNRSGNANSECQQWAWNVDFTMEPQREYKFRVSHAEGRTLQMLPDRPRRVSSAVQRESLTEKWLENESGEKIAKCVAPSGNHLKISHNFFTSQQ